MEQDLCNVGIIGAGPSGCACAYFLKKHNPKINISIIDYGIPLGTILPTGGGRCNFAHSEFDFKELAKSYPRGEKFLYSIFSKFSTSDTLEFFEELGIQGYTQEDGRIFPISNDSKEVRDKMLKTLGNCKFIKEKALRIEVGEPKFKVVTDMNSYIFDKLVYATGGHNGYEMIKRLGVSIIEPKPSLVGLCTKEKYSEIMGTVAKSVYNKDTGCSGEVLFTHFGISGPLIYKISSLYARKNLPYILTFDLNQEMDDFQKILNLNPHKQIKNLLGEYVPQKLGEFILDKLGISKEIKSHLINGECRDKIEDCIHNFRVNVVKTKRDGETVTSGGVSLDKINPKTMESKEAEGIFFCGEVVDIDGLCGGYNLQNCWSTAYVAACGVNYSLASETDTRTLGR